MRSSFTKIACRAFAYIFIFPGRNANSPVARIKRFDPAGISFHTAAFSPRMQYFLCLPKHVLPALQSVSSTIFHSQRAPSPSTRTSLARFSPRRCASLLIRRPNASALSMAPLQLAGHSSRMLEVVWYGRKEKYSFCSPFILLLNSDERTRHARSLKKG
jgi:hypothetical protein